MPVDLSKYTTGGFERGAGRWREALWLATSLVLFQISPLKLYSFKCRVLRAFGARVGRGVVIKPGVKITFPWKLVIGSHVWIGEECWLLNLEKITLGDHVCLSQRALLCTGNHNYKAPAFDLMVKPISVAAGVWIGAGAFVGPGVMAGSHAVLTAGSVATDDLAPFGIYRGNPAVLVKQRIIEG